MKHFVNNNITLSLGLFNKPPTLRTQYPSPCRCAKDEKKVCISAKKADFIIVLAKRVDAKTLVSNGDYRQVVQVSSSPSPPSFVTIAVYNELPFPFPLRQL